LKNIFPRTALCYIFFFSILIPAKAQSVTGRLLDKATAKPVSSAIIRLLALGANSQPLSFVFSKDDGTFSIVKPEGRTGYLLNISLLGFEAITIALQSKKENLGDIYLNQRAQVLKEIKVSPPKISLHRDTLSYLVKAFSDKKDRNIGDVLRRLPGIQISDNGTVSYNGQPINRFYIEGLDMLKGGYGQAVQNVSPADVGSVEVLENHQPVQALANKEFSDNAAINLKLSEYGRQHWLLSSDVLSGVPGQGSGSLTGMRFSKKSQDLDLVKANNFGETYEIETIDHPLESESEFAHVQIQKPFFQLPFSAPDLPKYRFLDNRTGFLALNKLYNLGNDQTIDIKGQIQDAINWNRSSNLTRYLIPRALPVDVSNSVAEHSSEHPYTLSINYNINSTKQYLDETFTAANISNISNGILKGTFNDLQTVSTNHLSASNILRSVVNIGRNTFKFSLWTRLEKLPERISIDDSVLGPAFQSSSQTVFSQRGETAIGFSASGFYLETLVGFFYEQAVLSSTLLNYSKSNRFFKAPHFSPDSTINKLTWHSFQLYAIPSITKLFGRFSLKLDLPLTNQLSRAQNFPTTSGLKIDQFYPAIRVLGTVKINSFWTFRLHASYKALALIPESRFSAYILTSYNTYSQTQSTNSIDKDRSAGLSIEYRNPLKGFFFNTSLSVDRQSRAQTIQSSIFDNFNVSRRLTLESAYKTIQLSGRFSKSFTTSPFTAGVSYGWSKITTPLFVQGVLRASTTNRFNAGPRFYFKTKQLGSIEYEGELKQSFAKLGQLSPQAPIFSQKHSVSVATNLTARIIGLITSEYYSSKSRSSSFQALFCDFTLRYLSSSHFDLSLGMRNLFNRRIFLMQQYDLPLYQEERFQLRPRVAFAAFHIKF